MKKYLYLIAAVLLTAECQPSGEKSALVQVDVSRVKHTLRGGMGASWHAISKDFPLHNEKYEFPVREIAPRGSAWGGNPPATDTLAWDQIKRHASWLGLDFIRVELSQRMYEPEKGIFDWENEEMQALYHILDWCQENNADVFLQQMWGYVEWNSIPGVHPLISAPKNIDDFAVGIATLMEYLTKEKGYSCIKYFGMTNEPPGGTWGYWWEYGNEKGSIEDAWKRLKEEFDRREIQVPVSGPGWTSMPPFKEEKLEFSKYFGALDIHSYDGVNADGEANLKLWAEWAHSADKPLFLTEYGNMKHGYGDDHPGQKSFDAALSNAMDVMRGIRAGVDGFNRWSFTNRGDLDGQWQLIQTFDRENKTYLSEVKPEKEAYYGFGILSRFFSKYASSVECTVSAPDTSLMAAALMSPGGELSIFIVNPENKAAEIELKTNAPEEKTLKVYQVSKEIVNQPGFELNPVDSFTVRKKLMLPPWSITTVSAYSLTNDQKGIILQ